MSSSFSTIVVDAGSLYCRKKAGSAVSNACQPGLAGENSLQHCCPQASLCTNRCLSHLPSVPAVPLCFALPLLRFALQLNQSPAPASTHHAPQSNHRIIPAVLMPLYPSKTQPASRRPGVPRLRTRPGRSLTLLVGGNPRGWILGLVYGHPTICNVLLHNLPAACCNNGVPSS